MISFVNRTTQKHLLPDKYLSINEIKQLLEYVRIRAEKARKNHTSRGIVNCLLVELMLLTGLRAEEVTLLELRDLPTYHGKDVIVVRNGKGNVMRTVEVKAYLKGELAKFIKECRKGARPGSPLFTNEAGHRLMTVKKIKKGKTTISRVMTSRLSYSSLYQRIRRIGRQAGILGLHPHIFRHTYGTFLHDQRKDLLFCRKQLGHSRVDTTAIYADVLDRDRRQQIENLFGPLFSDNVNSIDVK